MPLVYDQLGCC